MSAPVLAAQDLLRTNIQIWQALSAAEKDSLRSRYVVDVSESGHYGVIIDAQAVDESTSGTTGGAAIGQAYGSALYVDNAFKGPRPNYSATGHVTSAILGGLLGSTLDAPPQRRFHFRYTVRDVGGSIMQLDQVSDQPFRQPVGMCVSLPSITVATPSICEADVTTFRARYLVAPNTVHSQKTEVTNKKAITTLSHIAVQEQSNEKSVKCKLGTAALIYTSINMCKKSEGEIIQ